MILFGTTVQKDKDLFGLKELYNLSHVWQILEGQDIDSPDPFDWVQDATLINGEVFVSAEEIVRYLEELGLRDHLYCPFEFPLRVKVVLKVSNWLEEKARKLQEKIKGK